MRVSVADDLPVEAASSSRATVERPPRAAGLRGRAVHSVPTPAQRYKVAGRHGAQPSRVKKRSRASQSTRTSASASHASAGHRIWVSLVLDFLASGTAFEEILQNCPGLTRDDILACIADGAELARDRYFDLPE